MTDDDLLALYEGTVEQLYRYATRLSGGDRARADELVQDTYLAVLRRIRSGVAEPVDVGWLIVHCRHRFLDQLKSERRSDARARRLAERPGTANAGGQATEALDRLTVDHRVALVLRYVDNLSVPEVAAELRRSVHATESLLSRARAAMRAALAEGSR
jgi:RNA polymerase sigma-70 factor (ECF subfamily)